MTNIACTACLQATGRSGSICARIAIPPASGGELFRQRPVETSMARQARYWRQNGACVAGPAAPDRYFRRDHPHGGTVQDGD